MRGRVAILVAAAALVAALGIKLYLAAHAPPTQPSTPSPAPSPTPPPPPPPPPSPPPSPSPSPSPPPPPSPPLPAATDTRKSLLDNVRSSGPAKEHWDEQARALFNSLAHDDTIVAYEGCYVAGCAATLSFASEDDYRRAREAAESSEPYRAWTGGKKWSRGDPAEDGRVLVALVLYRPD